MTEFNEIARQYLKSVCGNIEEPNAKDIVKYCTPIISSNMRRSNSGTISQQEESDFENREIAKIARNAFIMGYICGQNDTY